MVGEAMATEGSKAAEQAEQQPHSAWPARRARRMAKRTAIAGKLEAALEYIVQLECQLEAAKHAQQQDEARHRAAASQAVFLTMPADDEADLSPVAAQEVLRTEVVARLALAAPVVEAVLAEERPPKDITIRRNAGLHCRQRRAAIIVGMSRSQLNKLQR